MGPPDLPCPPYTRDFAIGSYLSRRCVNSRPQVDQPLTDLHAAGPARGRGSDSGEGKRSRNARAQRRHREKRKIQFELLEHKILKLEDQRESLTNKLNSCASAGGGTVQLRQEFEAIQEDNIRLRRKNQELRHEIIERRNHCAPETPLPGVMLEEARSSNGRSYGNDLSKGPREYQQKMMCHCHDTSLTGLQSEDVYQEPGQQCSGMSLLSGLNPPAYVASSPTFADSPHHIDGRYQFGGGGSASGLPQASWNGGGSYYRASHPHVPPSHTIPRDLVTYTSDAGQVHDHENESWSNGLHVAPFQEGLGS